MSTEKKPAAVETLEAYLEEHLGDVEEHLAEGAEDIRAKNEDALKRTTMRQYLESLDPELARLAMAAKARRAFRHRRR